MFIGLIRLIRTILKTLRGSHTPHQLAVGAALGMLIGLLPKDNLLVVFVGLLIIVSNSNLLTATCSGFVCMWLGYLLDPISSRLGNFLLTHDRLTPTWTMLYELPLVPWTRFNDTIVFGSLVIGVLMLLPIYYLSHAFFTHLAPRIHQRCLQNSFYRWLSGSASDAKSITRHSLVRWGWVVPRLLILATLIGSVWLFKDRAMEYAIEKTGSTIVGAKVDVGQVKSSLINGQVRLHDIQIANKKSPMMNLVEAKYAGIELSTSDLLRKKLVIEEGKLMGVEFNTARDTSGKLITDTKQHGEPGILSKTVNELGKQWAKDLQNVLNQRLEENLETVRVSKDLIDSWPKEYAAVKARADSLQARMKKLRQLKDLKFTNPLRDLQTCQEALTDINETHREILELQAHLQKLRSKFDTDREALLTAKDTDKQRIKELMKTSKMSGKSMSQLLLGEQQGERVDQVLSWIHWLRETVPDPETDFQPDRQRGEEIIFPNLKQSPDFLIAKLMLNGKGTISDKPYQFRGTILDLTTQPKLHGKPTVVNLVALGDTPASVRAIVDQTGKARRDTLMIHCPSLQLKGQQLGSDDSLLVSLAPTEMDVLVKVQLVNQRLSGNIKLKQNNVHLNIEQLPSGIKDQQIKSIISNELTSIHQFEVVMNVSGTLDNPQWDFESDLGKQLADLMNNALQKTIDHEVTRLNSRVEQVAQEKLSELNALVAAKHAEAKHLLDTSGLDVAELQKTVKRVMELPLLRR